jgi:hypothetical protein
MISLRDDFEPKPDNEAHWPVPPGDLEFWKDVFAVLLPPEESSSEEQSGF